MGMHFCEYCYPNPPNTNKFKPDSSGEVTLTFNSGRSWHMPDMILRYIADHFWSPPVLFVTDVMNNCLVSSSRLQSKSTPTSIAFLKGEYQTGDIPEGFVEKLESLMEQAAEQGHRVQYRSTYLGN